MTKSETVIAKASANSAPDTAKISDFFVTTVYRCAPPDRGGGILRIDGSSGNVKAEANLAPVDPHIEDGANPRGGIRGARGLARIDENKILVSNYHSLFVFTDDLDLVEKHSHPLMSGIHAIYFDGNIAWVTSTSIDVLLGYNLKTRNCDFVYDVTAFTAAQGIGVKKRGLDLQSDFRADISVVRGDFTHLNSILKIEGKIYVLLAKFGAILEITEGRIVAQHRLLRGGHDLVYVADQDQIAVNDTVSQSILIFDRKSFQLVDRLKLARLRGAPHWLTTKKISLYSQKVKSRIFRRGLVNSTPLFMRGLSYKEGHFISGISPAAFFVTDYDRREIVGQYRLSKDTNETVYGVLPI